MRYLTLNSTDYYPFGMPMPGRKIVNGEPYRYAYQGQEKDPETGKEAFQLRLWDARIGRWLTTDPYGQFASPYLGMGNNPITQIDPDGGFSGPNDPPDEVDGGTLAEVIIYGKSNNKTGYVPKQRDWDILEMLRINAPSIYSSVKNRYSNGEYFRLGGGNWGAFSSQFQQGWLGRNNYPNTGVAEAWSNIAAVGIGGPLVLSNPVTASFGARALVTRAGRNMAIDAALQLTITGELDLYDMALSGGRYGRVFEIVTRSAIDIKITEINIYGIHGITNEEFATKLLAGGVSGFVSKYSFTDDISQYVTKAYFRGAAIGGNKFINWFNNGN